MSFFTRSASLFRCFAVESATSMLHKKDNVWFLRYLSDRQMPRLSKATKKSRSFGEGGYILLVLPATAFGLGTWQVQRREWKLGLIADLETKTQQPSVPLPLDLYELQDLEYRSVTVRGRFDHSREMYIGPRSNVLSDSHGGLVNVSGPSTGFYIVTPFKLSDRDLTILVNRGWVPPKLKSPESRVKGQVEGEMTISGAVRHNEQRNPFMPKGNQKSDGYWLYRNIEEMSSKADTAPVFIDADRHSTVEGGPLGGQTRVTLRNEHLSYIITWYSLATITFVMWYRRYRRPPPPDSAFNYLKKQP